MHASTKKRRLILNLFLLLVATQFNWAAGYSPTEEPRLVNTAHLDRLYQAIKLNGANVGLINIYSEFPDYRWVADDDEGAACIDDIARTVLFLVHEPDLASNPSKQDRLRKLTEFVLQMQSANGYFYNFIFGNGQINQTGSTSIDQPNWWSWRALWCLTEAYPHYKTTDPVFATRLQSASQRLVANVIRDFGSRPQTDKMINGLNVPTWLPYGSGTDQAAILLLGLLNYQQQTPDAQVLRLMNQLGDGIVRMQVGRRGQVPYGAILSFENGWHAYGCDQAYALLRVGKALKRTDWLAVAKREIDTFYPYILREGFLESFQIRRKGSGLVFTQQSRFAQIAYGVRPMIWAALELYDQTSNERYVKRAGELAGWFFGNNPARASMYDQTTGRGFDGIRSADLINRNAGAESTIEALLAFQRLEQYPKAVAQALTYRSSWPKSH